MLRKISDEAYYWLEGFLAVLPYSRIGNMLRNLYWAKKFNIMGKNISVFPGVRFFGIERITIGKKVSINCNTMIDACGGGIRIGNNVLIGPNCVIRAADHIFSDVAIPINKQGHLGGDVIIEDDCWLGANVVVLKKVSIGKGCVVGAGSVVTKNIPAYNVVAGVPARVIGHRK
jgi:acetyltransferase-like isoleucine patch superfamily enzyme